MKIAVIGIRGLPAGYSGFETCAEHTCKHWVSKGHSVLVYCRGHLYQKKVHKTDTGVELNYLPALKIKSLETLSHTFLACLHLCFFKRSYKIIHLYNCGNGIFVPLLKLFGKKVFVSVDGLEWKRKKWGFVAKNIYKFGAFISVKFADQIIVDNKIVEDFYHARFGKETKLIAYGAKIFREHDVENNSILEKHALRKKKYFIFVGRFVKEKGVKNLIESYLKLNTNYPLIVVGDDVEGNEYRDTIFDRYKNHPKVRLLGYKFGEEYETLLRNALMYVSASELEGTSPSLLAAMGAKVCVLVNGIEENIATLGNSGNVFKKNDLESLINHWQQFVNSPTSIEKSAKIGYDYVIEHYSWSSISNKYLSIFN
ncbi:DUF1972 domain-containing protein [Spongiivirga citrea]|uniref:DUF1972 domain-containing protein n=1 Tax=Spongiivirga citrea TaxID=1481457 RepID=A0A6M0CLV5_9FLAO|nr:DUF1972 domain-containing protein [Spongiivirga citrea]NER18915.1 DUF1972 domain-containing protein [Spongiivirga citrea]